MLLINPLDGDVSGSALCMLNVWWKDCYETFYIHDSANEARRWFIHNLFKNVVLSL